MKRIMLFLRYCFLFHASYFSPSRYILYIVSGKKTRDNIGKMSIKICCFICFFTQKGNIDRFIDTKILYDKEIEFDDSDKHFTEASALFSVTFSGTSNDEISETALSEIQQMIITYQHHFRGII